MNIGYLEVGSLAGNVKEMLGYLEPLYEEGYSVRAYFLRGEEGRILSFEEALEKLESSIPKENFILCPTREELEEAYSKEDLLIGGSPAWKDTPKLRFIKTLEVIPERREGVTYFAPTETLAKNCDVLHIPRAVNYLPFISQRTHTRKYDLTNACVANPNKRLELLNHLSKCYKVKVAILADYEYQLDYLSKLDNLKYELNLSVSEIGRMFGQSKILYQPSKGEKASITLDEALCAGCYPIACEKGSFWEQTSATSHKLAYQHSRPLDEKFKEIDAIMDMLEAQPEIHDEIAERSFLVKHRPFVQGKWLNLIRGYKDEDLKARGDLSN